MHFFAIFAQFDTKMLNLAILRHDRKGDFLAGEIGNPWPKTDQRIYLQKHHR